MVYKRNFRHFRVKPKNYDEMKDKTAIVFDRIPFFTTHTGWFSCKKTKNVSKINANLGLGLALYFK